MQLRKYDWIAAGLLIYAAAVLYLHFFFELSLEGPATVFLIVGIGFSFITWLLLKDLPLVKHRPAFRLEWIIVVALITWIVSYTTWGAGIINKLVPAEWLADERIISLVILTRKLLVFVAIPFLVYRAFGFRSRDVGIKDTVVSVLSKRGITVLISLSLAILLFSYFFSNGSKPVRDGAFSITQLLIGLPLTFAWLFVEAGLVEEFFYRGLLQSRLSVLLRSPSGGIVLSALIFGLSHAPGLYLRGAESEGIDEQLPFAFWTCYTIAYMSVAGIFLGMAWQKTRNLWLVVALHAMLDLLPNTASFIKTWGI